MYFKECIIDNNIHKYAIKILNMTLTNVRSET